MLTTTIQLRLTREVIDKVDQLRAKLSWHPNRAQTLRWMIEKSMPRLEQEAEPETRPHRRAVL